METFRTTCVLLMIVGAAAASDFSLCKLMGIYGSQNQFISVDEITDKCRTNFVTENGTEVHIVNLRVNPEVPYLMTSVSTDTPSILIFTSPDTSQSIYLSVSTNNTSNVKLYVTNKTSLKAFGCQVHSAPDVQGNELLAWATEQFGGVSSFVTLRDPPYINFSKLIALKTPVSSVCRLRQNLQTEAEAVQSCSLDSDNELHIINIPDHVVVRNVTVNVLSSKAKLVLRGPSGTVWNVNAETLLFSSNNVVHFNGMTMNPRFVLSDSDTELWTWTLGYFKNTSISSYTKIHLNIPDLQIWIRAGKPAEENARAEGKTTESPTSHISMQLFVFPDYTVELHPSTNVQTNKRIYAQVSSLVHGELELIINVRSCLVRSTSFQAVERRLSVKSEPCSPCRNSNRFSFLLDMLQDLPSNIWELRCNISFCTKQPKQGCSEPQLVTKNVQVTPYIPPPNPCFEFSLPAVLGIAFGGFLIGVLLIGTLWFIKIRTGYPVALGFGSTGTFFSGCPCSLTKRCAVPANPSPSENSSANGSMSSTQSTPTSSMA